jgi:hypothetical protein
MVFVANVFLKIFAVIQRRKKMVIRSIVVEVLRMVAEPSRLRVIPLLFIYVLI